MLFLPMLAKSGEFSSDRLAFVVHEKCNDFVI